LQEIEAQVRIAIRDTVNRSSRKPFQWGGLHGYQQLVSIAQALSQVPWQETETQYLYGLSLQVNRALENNRALATDLQEAHRWARQVAACLRYPPSAQADLGPAADVLQRDPSSLTSQQVAQEMKTLMQQFRPDFKRQPAQTALYGAWHRLWKTWCPDLLHCYDIPGLPPDNLQLEGLFGCLRRHQRRISGRKTTRELRDLGQCQVLFLAESEDDLLRQLRQVPLAEYQAYRRRLAEAEAPRQFLYRLHRNPAGTMRDLVQRHTARCAALKHDAQPP
jgi:hypothetical protein